MSVPFSMTDALEPEPDPQQQHAEPTREGTPPDSNSSDRDSSLQKTEEGAWLERCVFGQQRVRDLPRRHGDASERHSAAAGLRPPLPRCMRSAVDKAIPSVASLRCDARCAGQQ